MSDRNHEELSASEIMDLVCKVDGEAFRKEYVRDLPEYDQTAKADAGKPEITLVPTQIIRDIAVIRMYGNKKYGDPDNWKTVEPVRYRDALMRHLLAYIDDPASVDDESGLPHLWHAAYNIAFLCDMEDRKYERI